jgi:hypothetical protein
VRRAAHRYALGADGASQSIIISNNTFLDLSGGSVKLGSSGERGAPSPDPATPVAQQDRGYLVADNLMLTNTQEYSSANPIFVGYVADTFLVHNTIHDTKHVSTARTRARRGNRTRAPWQPNDGARWGTMGPFLDSGGVTTPTPPRSWSIGRCGATNERTNAKRTVCLVLVGTAGSARGGGGASPRTSA